MSMIDKQQAFNNQVSDFLKEFKHRFSILNHQGMPAKIGYTTKLQRKENCSLNVYLTDNFPLNPPIMYVSPKIDCLLLDEMGRVKDPVVSFWNINSTLVNSIRAILVKLEESNGDVGMSLGISSSKFNNQPQPYSMNVQPGYQSGFNNNMGQQNNWYSSMYTNNNNMQLQQDDSLWQPSTNISNTTSTSYVNNFGVNQVPQQNQNFVKQRTIYSDLNVNPIDKLGGGYSVDQKPDSFKFNNNPQQPISNQQKSNVIENDLNSKSIEELIYIYHNQEEYVSEFMEKHKSSINALKSEVDKLYGKSILIKK